DAVVRFIRKWDRPDRALHFCLTTLKPGSTRLDKLVCLHADLDFRCIVESDNWIDRAIEALPLRPQLVVCSGHGFHLYWLLREALASTPENIARIEAALRQLADVLAGDPSVCECARQMQLPGSHNTKAGAWIPGLMRLPGSHNTKAGGWIPVKVIKQRKGRHCLERMESWLATAKPVLQRREGVRGAAQHYVIQQLKQILASDRRC